VHGESPIPSSKIEPGADSGLFLEPDPDQLLCVTSFRVVILNLNHPHVTAGAGLGQVVVK